MSEQIQKALAELRKRLEAIYAQRLAAVLLYGSHARGQGREDSDVDVLVVLEGDVNAAREISRTIADVSEISLAHDIAITCLFVSRAEYEQGATPLLLNIRREGLEL